MQIFILFRNYLKIERIFSNNVQFNTVSLESSIHQFIFLNTFDKLYFLKYIFNYLIGQIKLLTYVELLVVLYWQDFCGHFIDSDWYFIKRDRNWSELFELLLTSWKCWLNIDFFISFIDVGDRWMLVTLCWW